MTDEPSAFSGHQPESRHGGKLPIFISWLVIALSVGLLFFKRESADESVVLPADPVNQTVDFQVRFLGRYAVGVNRLLPESERKTTLGVLEQFRRAAHSPADQLRAAVVTAEVEGSRAGMEILEGLNLDASQTLRDDTITLSEIWSSPSVDAARLTPSERSDLANRHGWFGRLALTWGLPESDALRRDALAPAKRTAIVGLSLGLGVVGLGLVGLILLIIAIVLFATGILRRAYVPPMRPASALLESFALWIAWYIGVSFVATMSPDPKIARALAMLALCAPLAALWPLLRGFSWRDLKFGLGWHTGRGFFREIAAGIVGYVAGMPIFLLGIWITLLITRQTGETPSHPIVNQISSDAVRVLKLLLLASVYAPIVEETMFRGALYSHLRRRIYWPITAICVAFLFAAIHPQGFAAIPALMGLAFVLGAMREWRNSLIAPITAHALNNGILVTALVLMAA